MPDLRASVKSWLEDADTWDEWPTVEVAILAVFDLHKLGRDVRGREICEECSALKAGVFVFAPCETVRTIAGKLGVEVDGG